MIELLHDLSDWTVGFADSDWAALALAVLSFCESIFFPVPPDPLLIGIGILQPENALWLAAVVTVSSVAGAFVGHWLGKRLGRPLLYRIASENKVLAVERMFHRHGAPAILIAAFTPLPYKVFAISAGVLDMDRRMFVVTSLIGRGARFFLLGGLIFFYGDSVQDFIQRNFDLLTIASGVAVAVIAVLAALYMHQRRSPKAAE